MEKPRLTVRPSQHGFIAQVSRGGDAWFVIAQEAPTRAAAEALVLALAAEALRGGAAREIGTPAT